MRRRGALVFVAAAALLSWSSGAQAQSRWDLAADAIVRLPPAAFPELPEAVAADLAQRGCTIPQLWDGYSSTPHNVVSGSFRRPGQTDWAVLCSRDGISQLLVYWAGAPDGVEEVGEGSEDRGWLQVVSEDAIGYSRAIHPVDETYIQDHYEAYGGPEPPPIDHLGINEAFAEKASWVHYWHEGSWLVLQGAD